MSVWIYLVEINTWKFYLLRFISNNWYLQMFFSNLFAGINKRLLKLIREFKLKFTEIEVNLKLNWIQIYWMLSLDLFQYIPVKNSSVNVDNVILFMFSSNVGFIVIWCRTCQNFEFGCLIQFLKYYKTQKMSSCSCLIPDIPQISHGIQKNSVDGTAQQMCKFALQIWTSRS